MRMYAKKQWKSVCGGVEHGQHPVRREEDVNSHFYFGRCVIQPQPLDRF